MTSISIGDLAQSLKLRQDSLRIRAELDRLSGELSSGVTSDLTTAVAGDFGALSSIENSMARLTSFRTAIEEAGLIVSTTQSVLENIQTNATELSGALLLAQGAGQPALVNTTAADARVRFESVVAQLNTRIADKSIFAGADIDGAAIATAEDILTELMTLIAGETTSVGVATVIDVYFLPGGGFDATGYLGSVVPASASLLSDGETVPFSVTAAASEMRNTLAAFAKAAILDSGALAGLADERAALASVAGEALLSAESGIVQIRAETGAREAQIDRAQVRNASEFAALEIARSKLISIDPFDVATELQAAETQLESLYTLTTRLSRLSLTEFLR